MKNQITTILLIVSSIITLKAQDSITFSNLTVPDAPSFMLLDASNTNIVSLAATKAFTLSVLNSFSPSIGLPQNYAAEVAPYWFIKSKNRTALRHLGYNVKSKKMNPFAGLKTSTFSVAFVNSIQDTSGNTVNNVALGARGTIFQIYPKGYKEKLYKGYTTIQALNKKQISEYNNNGYYKYLVIQKDTVKADSIKQIVDRRIESGNER